MKKDLFQIGDSTIFFGKKSALSECQKNDIHNVIFVAKNLSNVDIPIGMNLHNIYFPDNKKNLDIKNLLKIMDIFCALASEKVAILCMKGRSRSAIIASMLYALKYCVSIGEAWGVASEARSNISFNQQYFDSVKLALDGCKK